jgi:hypothetical protein
VSTISREGHYRDEKPTVRRRGGRDDGDEGSEKMEATADLLSRAPPAAGAWAMLAAQRLASGALAEEGVSSLAMSSLTGPNEGWIMARRAVIALPQWPVPPPESRRRAMTDLVAGWPAVFRSAARLFP